MADWLCEASQGHLFPVKVKTCAEECIYISTHDQSRESWRRRTIRHVHRIWFCFLRKNVVHPRWAYWPESSQRVYLQIMSFYELYISVNHDNNILVE